MAYFKTIGSSELPSVFGVLQLLIVLIAWTSYLACLGLYRSKNSGDNRDSSLTINKFFSIF